MPRYTIEQLNSMPMSQTPMGGQTPVWMRPKPPKKGKNFWTDQISTGGGIAGALGGALGGAAAGSVVPGLGTAVGGILGAILGGAGGSAGGEIAENRITGDSWDKNVAKEALIGGATSLPIGAGFKLARAGLKAGTGIGKTGVSELIDQAGRQVVPKAMGATTIKGAANSRVGKNMERLGGQMLNSQTQITGTQARRMGLRPVETMGRVSSRTGLTNFDDMAEVSRGLTGGDGSILDVLTREAVGSTSGVKLPDLRQTAVKLLDDKGTLLTDSQRKDILRNVKNAATTMYGGSKGSLSALANPQEALNQANKFRAAAQSISSRSLTATPEQADMAKVYSGLAKNIEDALYKSPGVNNSIGDLTRFGQTSLREMAGEAAAAGNKAQADAYLKVADELAGVKNVQQLRKMKKDFVDVGKMDNATAQADGARQFNAESASSMLKGSPIRGTIAAVTGAAMPRVGGALGKAGRRLQGEGASAVAGRATQNIPMLAGRQAGARLLTGGAGQPGDPALEQAPMDAQLAGMEAGAMGEDQMQQEPSIQLGNGQTLTPSMVQMAMAQALMEGNEDAAGQLEGLLGLFPSTEAPDLSSSTAQLAAKQATGIQALDQLEASYSQAGGGQGVIGGNLANLAGDLNLNSAAGVYNDNVAGTARQIARAMGEVGAGSDADAQAFISRLPRLTDSPERAAQKIAELRALLQASQQNTLMYGAGAKEQYGSNY